MYASTETLPAPPTLSASVARLLNSVVWRIPMAIVHRSGGGRSDRPVARSRTKRQRVHDDVMRAMNVMGVA